MMVEPFNFCRFYLVAVILLPWPVEGTTNEEIRCELILYIPEGCVGYKMVGEDVTKYLQNYPVSQVKMKAKNNFVLPAPSSVFQGNHFHGDVVVTKHRDEEWCELTETRDGRVKDENDVSFVKEKDSCISLDKNFTYIDHIQCPREGMVLIQGLATLTPDSDLWGVPDGYEKDTTALEMKCFAKFPLGISFDRDVPFSEILVTSGRSLLNTEKRHSESSGFGIFFQKSVITYEYWTQLELPKNPKTGDIDQYSGNYSFYSVLDSSQFKNIELLVEPLVTNEDWQEEGSEETEMISIHELQASCWSEFDGTRSQIYFSNIGGKNPIETNLHLPCLDKKKACQTKQSGMTCPAGPACEVIPRIFQNGVVRCVDEKKNKTEERHYFLGLDFLTHYNFTSTPLEALINLQLDDGESQNEIEILEKMNNSQEILVYDQARVKFECQFIPYLLTTPIEWHLTFGNDSERMVALSQPGDLEDETIFQFYGHKRQISMKYKSAVIELQILFGWNQISCSAGVWNSTKILVASKSLVVQESRAPIFKIVEENALRIASGQHFNLTCAIEPGTQPAVEYFWKINQLKINSSSNENCIKVVHHLQTSTLQICNAGQQHDALFTCTATNFRGNVTKTFPVKIYTEGGATTSAWIYSALACAILGILLFAFLSYRLHLRQRARMSSTEIVVFQKGNDKKLKTDNWAHQNAQFLPYDESYEIPWEDIQIDDRELGRGAYGVVLRASVRGHCVAAKTVVPDVEKSVVMALLAELKIMIHMGKHENIVELVGASTKFLKQGKPYVFVEFCGLGSLENFLKCRRAEFIQEKKIAASSPSLEGGGDMVPSTRGYVNFRKVKDTDLLNWTIQIAQGMAYLEENRILHGDLATRNVLLSSMDLVKITDFGLSRQLLDCTTYVKKHQQLLPFRWLAIESLKYMIFTAKSDVWSYGVTVWEIYSMAQTPYSGLSWSEDFLLNLENNVRLPRPRFCPNDDVYQIMLSCWKAEPEERPSFLDLAQKFRVLL